MPVRLEHRPKSFYQALLEYLCTGNLTTFPKRTKQVLNTLLKSPFKKMGKVAGEKVK